MLVLSRRAQQEIIFPNLGIRINVLKVQGRLVKLGIEAPPEIPVFRKESISSGDEDTSSSDHRRRNELNLLHLKIEMLQRKIDRGEQVDLLDSLSLLVDQFASLDHALGDQPKPASELRRARRLLVVEDCDNERQLLAYLLASNGFDVQVARDGQEAMQFLKHGVFRPQIVLLDMQMPTVGGAETLQMIRNDDSLSTTKVFAVTGQRMEDEPDASKWDGWFQKPVNIKSLLKRLEAEPEPQLMA